jgi:hypothetical protein
MSRAPVKLVTLEDLHEGLDFLYPSQERDGWSRMDRQVVQVVVVN